MCGVISALNWMRPCSGSRRYRRELTGCAGDERMASNEQAKESPPPTIITIAELAERYELDKFPMGSVSRGAHLVHFSLQMRAPGANRAGLNHSRYVKSGMYEQGRLN